MAWCHPMTSFRRMRARAAVAAFPTRPLYQLRISGSIKLFPERHFFEKVLQGLAI